MALINTLRPGQNGRRFADNIFKCIFLNENVWIPIKTSLFVPEGPINNIPTLVQIMAWRQPGDKPLSEPMMVRLLTHICVTWPQWVNKYGICMQLIMTNSEINTNIYCMDINMTVWDNWMMIVKILGCDLLYLHHEIALTQWHCILYKMATILHTTFSNGFFFHEDCCIFIQFSLKLPRVYYNTSTGSDNVRSMNHLSLFISVAYRYRKSISIIELFVSIISIYIGFLATNF